MCFNNSIVQLKLTWPLVFFLKISKTVAVGIVMHTRITLCWRSPNCLALDLEHFKTLLAGEDVIESCACERVNTMWKFFRLTIVTLFAALLTENPMGCKDT